MSKLAKCPTCAEKISKEAPSCPKCGQPLPENWQKEADAKAFVQTAFYINLLVTQLKKRQDNE